MTEIIGIVSGKGGVGKTTVAVNLSLALKQLKKKVLLIDANVTTPHLSYYLGVTAYNYTLNDILSGKVDTLSAISSLDGLRYIPASTALENLKRIDPLQLEKIVEEAAKYIKLDYIIIDSAPGIGREVLSVMSVAKRILFVTTPHLPAIADVIRCKEILQELGDKKIGIVLNMYSGYSYEASPEVVEALTGIEVLGEIPYDKNVSLSLAVGMPLLSYKQDSVAALSFMRIAHRMIGEEFYPTKLKFYRAFARIKDVLFNSVKLPDVETLKAEILKK